MTARNQRSHPRANTLLPFAVRRLDPDESREPRARVATDAIVIDDTRPPVVKDEALNLWLNMLNAKLDYLIRQAAPRREEVLFMTVEPLNISAGGMSLLSREPFEIGDVLEIRMVLQSYPPKILFLYGETVRIEASPPKTGGHIVSVRFLGMDDEVRDEILKFDFQKHRKRLAEGRKG